MALLLRYGKKFKASKPGHPKAVKDLLTAVFRKAGLSLEENWKLFLQEICRERNARKEEFLTLGLSKGAPQRVLISVNPDGGNESRVYEIHGPGHFPVFTIKRALEEEAKPSTTTVKTAPKDEKPAAPETTTREKPPRRESLRGFSQDDVYVGFFLALLYEATEQGTESLSADKTRALLLEASDLDPSDVRQQAIGKTLTGIATRDFIEVHRGNIGARKNVPVAYQITEAGIALCGDLVKPQGEEEPTPQAEVPAMPSPEEIQRALEKLEAEEAEVRRRLEQELARIAARRAELEALQEDWRELAQRTHELLG